jgi:flagellar motor switch protein FliG
VALTGKQKAAMLLMSLDAVTAAELLKGVDARVVQDLAVEVAYLDAAGYRNSKQGLELALQFCDTLRSSRQLRIKDFLNQVLKSTVGSEKAEQIQAQIRSSLQKRDPFIPIRSSEPQALAAVLEDEHPQTIAVILSELPAKKSSQVLGFLDKKTRLSTISRMANAGTVNSQTKIKIAQIACKRLETGSAVNKNNFTRAETEQPLRKVAVILRNLGKELRDGLLGAIEEKDSTAGKIIADLMLVWEDIPQVEDSQLRNVLREIEAKKLATALVGADEAINQKIRSNISRRVADTIDEETSLMPIPSKGDIEHAREEIVDFLRKVNEKGKLAFIKE